MSTNTRASGGRRSGTTLVEVLIASAILVFIVLMAMVVMMNASGAAAKASISGELENRARATLERCRAQFMTARFRDPLNPTDGLGMHINNTFLWYQIPVSANNSGSTVWGYSSTLGRNDPEAVDRSCILRFEAETVLLESNVSPLAVQPSAGPASVAAVLPALPTLETPLTRNIDYNRDGDFVDTFVKGRIMQYIVYTDPTDGTVELLTEAVFDDNVMLAVVGTSTFNGDFDGLASTDAEQDVLFRWINMGGATVAGQWPSAGGTPDTTARAIVVSIWHGAYSDDGKAFYVRRGTETIRFKNSQ